MDNPLQLQFVANDYGPLDAIWFNDAKRDKVALYLKTEAKAYLPALEKTAQLIDGFEPPFRMELLSTVDWLLTKEQVAADTESLPDGMRHWPAGERSAKRKLKQFDQPKPELALSRLKQVPLQAAG